MTTTIQVAENLTISKYMEINGVRCEVEAASFTPAIFEGQANEELLKVIADELIERNVIKEERGQYYFCASGEPLIPDEDWESEEGPSIEQIKEDAPEGAVYWSPFVEQYFDSQFISLASKEDGKLIQVAEELRSELLSLSSFERKQNDSNDQ